MRSLGPLAVVLLGTCAAPAPFAPPCVGDENCNLSAGGRCLPSPLGSDQCAYPSSACGGGFAWGELSADLDQACVGADADASVDAPFVPDGPAAIGWDHLFSSASYDQANGVAADSVGNVFVVGTFDGNATLAGETVSTGGATDLFVAKIAPSGARQWVRRFGGTAMDAGLAIAARGTGVAAVGSFGGTADFGTGPIAATAQGDGLVIALNADGSTAWVAHAGGTGAVRFKAVATGSGGEVYVLGEFAGAVDFGAGLVTASGTELIVIRYSSTGAHDWSRRIGAAVPSGSQAVGIDAHASGSVAITGTFYGSIDAGGGTLNSSGASDVLLASFNGADCAHRWSMRLGSANADSVKGIAATSSGIAIAGCFAGTGAFGGAPLTSAGSLDAYVAMFDNGGAASWSVRHGGSGSDCASAIASKANGSLLVAGPFSGTATIGASNVVSEGNEDVWLAELSATNGAVLTARSGGGTASDIPSGIVALDPMFALVGYSSGAANLFGRSLVTGGMMDGFAIQTLQ